MGNNLGKNKMNNNKETQTRREFFKNAARKALPILGAIALFRNPLITKAAEHEVLECNGCQDYCVKGCRTGCGGGCHDHCALSCSESCIRACRGCEGGCENTCKGSCRFSNR